MYNFSIQKKITPGKIYFIAKCCTLLLLADTSVKSFAQNLSGARNNEIIQYLQSNFADKITDVIVTKNDVTIKGGISPTQGALYLGELRMYDETKLVKDSFASVTPIDTKQPTFSIRLGRFTTVHDTGYDRIYSRWVIVSKNGQTYQLQSYANYPTDLNAAENQYLPEEKPVNKKGLAGFSVAPGSTEDMLNLGVKDITVNIVIPNYLTFTPTAYAYTLNGQKYYFNVGVVANLDKTIKTCTDNNVTISGLLLIQRGLAEPRKSIFNYPTSDSGVHSMANITSITGLNYYAAVVGFLAERYSRPDKQFGRISNWVIHNEVDAGYYWANAGPAGMPAYTELYDRSARTVYYTIRQYNPSGKVFLSLTHFWATAPKAKYFAPKDMLDLFDRLSDRQGDYEWGIAYHAYPENLREPATWNDKDATLNINTAKVITPKNIELLDTWVCMRAHLYKGLKVRSIMLTEQGIHTKSYNPQDLTVQAAGLAYMWKKVNRVPTIESFDYHDRTDNTVEFGMKFGLWTLKAGTMAAPDQKKRSWFLYQKAGTPSEDSAFAFALPIIGVRNWSQIFNPLNEEASPQKVTFNITDGGTSQNDVSVYFNGEMHKTINGQAIFYNVAALSTRRSYRLERDGKSIYPEQSLVITKDQIISVDIRK